MDFSIAESYNYPLLIKYLLKTPFVYHSDQEIIYGEYQRFSYQQFYERVGRLAALLLKLGYGPGKTIAVMDRDSHRYLECFYAVPMIGATLYTVNVRLSPDQLVYTINHAESDLLIINNEFLPLLEGIKDQFSTLDHFILINEEREWPATTVSFRGEYEELLNTVTPLPLNQFPDFDEQTRATLFFTTGTTGVPKAVHFSHRQLVLQTLVLIGNFGARANQGRLHHEDVYMPLTPMFHAHAWGLPYAVTMLGLKQVYPGRYIPKMILKLIAKEGVTFSHCVPTILQMLFKEPLSKEVDLSRWKVIIGGSALTHQLTLSALKRGIDIVVAYGLSETCPIASMAQLTKKELTLSLEEQSHIRNRPGTPFGLVDISIIDEKGDEVPKDNKSSGEIVIRAPWCTQSYLKDQESSQKLWRGGWLHTQDVGVWNEGHSIAITDRLKDLVKVGGEWISSLKLEDILMTHPEVEECAVIGVPDARWGEIPLGIVVLASDDSTGVNEHGPISHIKGAISQGILQREAICIKFYFAKSIPKTSVGKIDKVALRKIYSLKHK